MIRIVVTETGRGYLKDTSQIFNEEVKQFESIEEVREYLIERYGRIPSKRNKIYIDTVNGETIEVGFTYSYWNQDISHNSAKWYQTDWISFDTINYSPFDIKQI